MKNTNSMHCDDASMIMLYSCALLYVLFYQDFRSINWHKTSIHDTLKNQYVQEWRCTVDSCSKVALPYFTFGYLPGRATIPLDLCCGAKIF